jgi:hypothetical protein
MKGSLPKIAVGGAIIAVILSAIAVIVTVRRRDPEPPPRDPVVATHPTPDAAIPPDASPDASPDAATCTATCTAAEDCKTLVCPCEDGTIVNERDCNDNCCVPAPEACSDACLKHDGPKGSWNAAREGGKQTGKSCGGDDECGSKICVRGYCSRSCTSFGDCPPFWDCNDSHICIHK